MQSCGAFQLNNRSTLVVLQHSNADYKVSYISVNLLKSVLPPVSSSCEAMWLPKLAKALQSWPPDASWPPEPELPIYSPAAFFNICIFLQIRLSLQTCSASKVESYVHSFGGLLPSVITPAQKTAGHARMQCMHTNLMHASLLIPSQTTAPWAHITTRAGLLLWCHKFLDLP